MRVEGTGERAIGRIAAAQRGLVQPAQLRTAGLDSRSIGRLLARGSLYPVLPRVYAVGHPALAPLARELAVVLHCGRDAAIGHRSATTLWGMLPDDQDDVQVTIIGRDIRRRPGLELYRVAALDLRDVRLRYGIPVTAPARTLVDLAARSDDAVFERALSEARVMRLVTDRDLQGAIDRCPRRTGVARVRAWLHEEHESGATRSDAERRLLSLLGRAQLPRPEVNVCLCGYEVDFLWRPAKLIVEVDGHAFHGHRTAFERDRRRDQVLAAAGYRVIRVTWRQLIEEPLAVAVRLGQALARDA